MMLVANQRAIGNAKKTVKELMRRIGLTRMAFGVEIADLTNKKAQEYANTRTRKTTGRLGRSIKPIVIVKRPTYTRIEISTDASYAPWIEWGAGAPIGLPYSNLKTIKKDYSKSSYRGIKFMTLASKYYVRPIKLKEVFVPILIKTLSGL